MKGAGKVSLIGASYPSPEHAAASSEVSEVDGINENRIADESFAARPTEGGRTEM